MAILLVQVISVLMCVIVPWISVNATVLNGSYMKRELRENNVYAGLTETVKKSAREAYFSGEYRNMVVDQIIDPLLDEVVRPEPLRKELEQILDLLYAGKPIQTFGGYFVEDYNQSIRSFAADTGLNVSGETLDRLANTVSEAVVKNVDVSRETEDIAKDIREVWDMLKIGNIVADVALVVLLILLILFAKDKLGTLSIPLLLSGGLMLGLTAVLYAVVPKDYQVLNQPLTDFLHSVINGVLRWMLICSLLYLALGVVLRVIRRVRKKRAAAPAEVGAVEYPES